MGVQQGISILLVVLVVGRLRGASACLDWCRDVSRGMSCLGKLQAIFVIGCSGSKKIGLL